MYTYIVYYMLCSMGRWLVQRDDLDGDSGLVYAAAVARIACVFFFSSSHIIRNAHDNTYKIHTIYYRVVRALNFETNTRVEYSNSSAKSYFFNTLDDSSTRAYSNLFRTSLDLKLFITHWCFKNYSKTLFPRKQRLILQKKKIDCYCIILLFL